MKKVTNNRTPNSPPSGVRTDLFLRLLGFCLLWWVLAEGSTYNLWLGIAAAGAATIATVPLWPPGGRFWTWRGVLRFWPFFFWQSLVGGIDVARRAFSPSMPMQPALIRFQLRLQSPPAAAFLAWTIGLLPGTASVRLRGNWLEVHVLDDRQPVGRSLREVEARVAALFSQELKANK